MKKYLFLLFSFLLFSCKNDTEVIETEKPVIDSAIQAEISKPALITLDTNTYPSHYCLDSSWNVSTDIQEGFFLNYSITYENGKKITVPVDDGLPLIGGVDHPEPHYTNDTTYFIPHVAGSSLGYFELYIYKNGSCKYVEKISPKLPPKEIEAIIDERENPSPKQKEPVINNTFSYEGSKTLFRRKATYYGRPDLGCDGSSHSFRFNVNNAKQDFVIEGDSLATIEFHYSESGGLYYAYGNKPYNGSIVGQKQENNTWIVSVNIWLPLKNDMDTNQVKQHIQIEDSFTTY